jgi:AbrB family looped-hinge helix DNA binding protein
MAGELMNQIATTKLSSKGQVVIPEIIRESLHMEAGTQFVVIGLDDTIVLKSITPPPMSKFKSLLSKAEKAAKAAGLKKSDVNAAISQVRKAKKLNK